MKGYIKELQISGVGKQDAKSILTLNSTKQIYEVINPLETLLCSLAACENVTIRFHAKENNFEVRDVNFIKLYGIYDTTGFFQVSENNIIKEIEMEVEVETNIEDAQFQKMHFEIQKKCPVYQMLEKSGVMIKSKFLQKKY